MTIVIKIGSALLSTPERKLNIAHLKHMVEQVADLHKDGHKLVLVSSGAVLSGRDVANFEKEKRLPLRRQMYAALGQANLMREYSKAFSEHDILAAQSLITRENFADREEHNNLVSMLQGLLDHRVVPILNENDAVANLHVNFGGNDLLCALTAASLKADRLIILTNVDHLYDKDPTKNKDATPICEVKKITPEIERLCAPSSNTLSIGGMLTKIQAAKIATESGIATYFANGLQKNILKMIMKEVEKGRTTCIGTYFKPQAKHTSKLKYWLKHCSLPKGTITIDDGATKALKSHKSLLFVGVRDLSDGFEKGDTVTIVDLHNQPVGTGQVNYSSEHMKKAMETKKNLQVVVHIDNMSVH
ncbi:MAG: glutamate 5-kinase [bacterium]|nr:glutamate 5-kinase [bacterium]